MQQAAQSKSEPKFKKRHPRRRAVQPTWQLRSLNVTKPFGVRKLIARIHALLGRGQPARLPTDELPSLLHFGDVEIDVAALRGTREGGTFERAIRFALLYRERVNAVSRDRIFHEIWGIEYCGTTRTLDQVVVRLRQKIESEPSEPGIC